MCRLFGLVAGAPVSIQYWMEECPRPFKSWSGEHCHGWGICWYENGKPRLVKQPGPARDSDEFVRTAGYAKSNNIIAHLRKGTQGADTPVNCHPFVHGKWVFAHNGSVDRDYLMTKLQNSRHAIQGETDSEVYFHWLLENLEKGGVEGLRIGISEVRKRQFTALNFLLSDGHTLSAYWEQSTAAKPPSSDYYQLWYARRSDSRTGARQVIVCSERLDDEPWERIPQRSLLTVTPELQVDFAVV